MNGCKNCYYYGKCSDTGQPCEYYDPVVGVDSRILNEYTDDLIEREREYREIVDEQDR